MNRLFSFSSLPRLFGGRQFVSTLINAHQTRGRISYRRCREVHSESLIHGLSKTVLGVRSNV